MKLLITDSVFPKNGGDSAILLQMMQDLKERIPDAEFIILSKYKNNAKERLFYPVYYGLQHKISHPFPFDLFSLFKLIIKISLNINDDDTIEAYRNADCVISCGGGFLRDGYRLYRTVFGYYVAKKMGKPAIIYAQSIGPLKKIFNHIILKWVLNKLDLIITRDFESKKWLNKLKINKPMIAVTADVAINFPASPQHHIEKLMEKEGIDNKDKIKIGISVRKWIYPHIKNKTSQLNHYIKTMAELTDYIVENIGANIIFLSTCNARDYAFQDHVIAEQIKKRMRHLDKVKIIKKDYKAEEIKGLFSKMDLCICTRMHSLIFATTMGVPSIGIEYEFKTREYMKRLGLEDYVVNIVDIDYKELKESFDTAWKNRKNIRKQLKEKLPNLQTKAKMSAKLVSDLLERNGT